MTETLSDEEHTVLMAKRGELNWLATQSMFQLLAPLSLIDTSKTATGQSLKDLNRLVRQRLPHCEASGKLHYPVISDPVFVSFSDAAWANRKDFGSQCGYLCIGTERSLLDGSAAPCCPISWHSRRCPRVARSSGSAETQYVTQAQEETEFILLLWLETVQGGYDDTVIDQEIAKVGCCLIIDAKGVFDAIHRSESAALSTQDPRSAVEGLALREAIGQTKTLLRWCHSEANVAGALTKNWTTELTSCYVSFSDPKSGELCGIQTSQVPKNSNSRRKPNSQEHRDAQKKEILNG